MAEAVPDAPEVTDDGVDEADDRGGGFGSLGSIVYLLVLTWAAGIASFPLNDNSFFTHLATGRIILEEGSVPSSDPYTFTAQGEPWTVQSWLASVSYAGFERLGGGAGIKVLVLLVTLTAAAILWRLSRPIDSVILRLGLAALALVVASGAWSERPYMVGVVGVGVLLLVLDGEIAIGWVIPLMWVWANAHGSFPFALALCALVLAGEMLDQRQLAISAPGVRRELQTLGGVAVGTLLAVIGPLWLSVLTFPGKALSQSSILSQVKEWQPPDFQSTSDRAFLLLAALAILAIVRTSRWRWAIPVVFFVCVSMVAQRNIPFALMVLVPAVASAAPALGTLRNSTRPALGAPLALVAGTLLVAFGAVGVTRDEPGLDRYPTRQLAWLGSDFLPEMKTAMQERNGNLVEVLDGPGQAVFFDDRFDMFPASVAEDYLELLNAKPGWGDVLSRYAIDAVVWQRDRPLGAILVESSEWRVVLADTEWIVACRRGSPCDNG